MIQAKGGWHWLIVDPEVLDLLLLQLVSHNFMLETNTPLLSCAFCFLPNYSQFVPSNAVSLLIFTLEVFSFLCCFVPEALFSHPHSATLLISLRANMHHLKLLSVILIRQAARWIQRNRGMCTLQKQKLSQNFAEDKGFQVWTTLSFEIHWSRECKCGGLFFSWPFAT